MTPLRHRADFNAPDLKGLEQFFVKGDDPFFFQIESLFKLFSHLRSAFRPVLQGQILNAFKFFCIVSNHNVLPGNGDGGNL